MYLTLTYVAAREVCSFSVQLLTFQNISDNWINDGIIGMLKCYQQMWKPDGVIFLGNYQSEWHLDAQDNLLCQVMHFLSWANTMDWIFWVEHWSLNFSDTAQTLLSPKQ